MGWNGSSGFGSSQIKAQNKKVSHKKRVRFGIVAGLILILIIVTLFMLFTKQDVQHNEDSQTKITTAQIPEVKPSISSSIKVEKKKEINEMTDEERLMYYKEKYGDNPPDNLKTIIHYLKHPPKTNFSMKPSKFAIFKHPSERAIAGFISVVPGSFVVRPQTFDASFDKDFAESMFDKIEILETDTEEQRILKEAVIATKKELADRAKNGENPSEILTEYAQQLYDLGQYRVNLQQEIIKTTQDINASDADVEDIVAAANKLLSDKGLQPIRMPNLAARQLNLERQIKNLERNDK